MAEARDSAKTVLLRRSSLAEVIGRSAEKGCFGVRSVIQFLGLLVPSHPVLDVVIDDEIQLLLREPVVRRQHPVDFIDDILGKFWDNTLDTKMIVLKPHLSKLGVCLKRTAQFVC